MAEVTLFVPDRIAEARPQPQDIALTAQQLFATNEFLVERLAALELALEDEGWELTSQRGAREFSRDGLRRIIERARLMYLSNPMIRRPVEVQANYVFGQGVEFEAEDLAVNDVVQAFLNDPKNRAEFSSLVSMWLKEIDLACEGNLFFVFFVEPVKGRVRVRSIGVDEIHEVICNPEDAGEPWFYRRVWMEQRFGRNGAPQPTQMEALYPDWQYTPRRRQPTYGGKEIRWDTPVQHVKAGGLSKMRFGVPEVYPALDWAKAYREQLEDDATRSRALARFAMKMTTGGNAAAVTTAKERLNTTYGTAPRAAETNPPPLVASTFIGRRGKDGQPITDIEAVDISRAMMPTDHSRPFRLMVAAAVGLPETFLGDADVGNHATAKTLDRPTELMMTLRRELWASVWSDMLSFVIRKAVQAPAGPLRGRYRVTGNGYDEPYQVVGVRRAAGQLVDATVHVVWAPLLEHDVSETVKAIVTAATLDGKQEARTIGVRTRTRLLLTALGVKEIDELLDAWFADADELPDEPEPAPVVAMPTPREAEFTEAVREMRDGLAKLS